MYSVLFHLFRFPLPKNLRCFCWQVHIIAIARTWESIRRKWELGNPIGAPQLGRINTYTAHTLLFFQLRSTLSNRPNWGSPIGVFSLARAIQSDPIGVRLIASVYWIWSLDISSSNFQLGRSHPYWKYTFLYFLSSMDANCHTGNIY